MAKITSKLQVTVPKALAEQYHIQPGDEIRFEAAGDVIRVVPLTAKVSTAVFSVNERLELFDAATTRQRKRKAQAKPRTRAHRRGWTREDLYQRGHPH